MKHSPQDTLYPWLESREELLWSGRPDPLRMARARIGISLAGLAVVLLLSLTPLRQYFTPISPTTSEALSYSQSDIHFVEAIPFSLFLTGLLLFLQPFAAYYYAGRTTYAVTGKRLLMVRKDLLGILVKTARYDAIEDPILNQRVGGTGDIFFFRKASIPENGRGPSPLTKFQGIRDAEQVLQLIRGRLPVPSDRLAPAEPVQDYLQLLVRGERRLDDIHDR
ncbi:MAG: hypothetical protein AABZ15_17405 [Nitrospirota bacterium]